MIPVLAALGWGLVFGLGLVMAGVSNPRVILGFLDVGGAYGPWDPTLGVAITAAMLTYRSLFRRLLRRGKPVLATRFDLPMSRRIDARLVVGAGLFGAGWGIAGMCPGANLVALGSSDPRAWLFAVSWIASLLVLKRIEEARSETRVPRVA